MDVFDSMKIIRTSSINITCTMLDPWYNKGFGGELLLPEYDKFIKKLLNKAAYFSDLIYLWGFPEVIGPYVRYAPEGFKLSSWLTWYYKNCPSVICGWRISSIGIERNPFFYKIGYAKMNAKLVMEEISFIFEEFTKRKKENNNLIKTLSIDAQTYLIKLFDLETLETLLVLRNLVNSYTDKKYYMGFIFLSKMLQFTTKAKTDGIYKVPSETKRYIDITEAITRTSTIMCEGKAEIECIENS